MLQNISDSLQSRISFTADKMHNSLSFKLIIIGLIILLLQIPTLMVYSLITERKDHHNEVTGEISKKWSLPQTITGPALYIPVLEKSIRPATKPNLPATEETRFHTLTLLPETLDITGKLDPEIRYRGIYQAVLYRSELTINAKFKLPARFHFPHLANSETLLKDTVMVLGISDLKGISAVTINQQEVELKAIPGVPRGIASSGFQVPLNVLKELKANDTLKFSIKLQLNGSKSLSFYPLGRANSVQLAADWNSPSFSGEFLPHTREITDTSFKAEWKITDMNRNYPQSWLDDEHKINGSEFGVGLHIQANVYQQAMRAIRYSVLFIIFSMLAFLLAEMISKVWMHPLQYLMVGLAIVMFYALLIAISEHFGFQIAYWSASIAIVGALGLYCSLIFRCKKATASITGAMALTYILLYFMLQLEDYALLTGSIVLFALLVLVMILTGKINRSNPN